MINNYIVELLSTIFFYFIELIDIVNLVLNDFIITKIKYVHIIYTIHKNKQETLLKRYYEAIYYKINITL